VVSKEVDLHGLNTDFFDSGRNLGPDMFLFMPVDVLLDQFGSELTPILRTKKLKKINVIG